MPQGWAVFGADPMARWLADPQYAIEHWTEFDPGGHFAAMEASALLVGDIRTFFRQSR